MIHPVILSGGSGTRLWPRSRSNTPKQFLQLVGDATLFQATARRVQALAGAAPVSRCCRPVLGAMVMPASRQARIASRTRGEIV